MSTSSTLQREREVQGHLQSWRIAQGSSLNVALNVDSISLALDDLRDQGYTPQASSDKALTAFAQLAVLRLDVKRGMVSLIDESTQTILAEATRNLLLGNRGRSGHTTSSATEGNESRHAESSDLWLGSSVLPRAEAVCEHSMVDTCTARDSDGRSYTTTGLIVPDCRLDPRFQNRSYVVSEPGVRFYAGVPIVSRRGHKLGSYAVSDDKPRHGLTVDELYFMEGVAQAVMDHLEWAQDRVDRFKGDRIVRGLATFIEGCSGSNTSAPEGDPSLGINAKRPLDVALHGKKRSVNRAEVHKTLENPAEPPARMPSRSASPTAAKPIETDAKPKMNGFAKMFHQAADTLRLSTFADGVAIFGATAAETRRTKRDGTPGDAVSSDDDDMSWPSAPGSESHGLDSSDSDTSQQADPCKMLAFSLGDDRHRAAMNKGSALSVGTLERYFAMYPRGKTFSFTEEGHGFSSEEDSASDREPVDATTAEDSRGSRRRKSKMDHRQLLKKIPGAKHVVFLPLFDYIEDRLAGGVFLWAMASGRMMNLDDDLSHLRAFGNSIMNQVGRINTQRNEAAKTTFIASMSHELRSPLHGILGAVEFLKDTAADSYQTGLINSISICGRTLLDTLNHVLDYSKINRLGRAHMRRAGKQAKASLAGATVEAYESINMTTAVDLSVLVEEVVDAVAAGHTFKESMVTRTRARSDLQQPTSASSRSVMQVAGSEGPVSVLLDICPLASWMVKTQPGAVRRIIMNLFGNALKYTPSGYVLVTLRGQLSADKSKIDVLIRVQDTGIGMSEDYQQNRLFIPFSQEDSFQPGTGLGLSIVKQIVDSLRGKLEVRSTRRQGTEVDVRLHLPALPAEVNPADEALHSAAEMLKGLRLVIVEGDEGPRRDPKSVMGQSRKINEVLAKTCSTWFNMRVEEESGTGPMNADLCIYCEPPSIATLKRNLGHDTNKASPQKRIPIVIVCLNSEEAARISRHQSTALAHLSHSVVEVIPQPCGPRKLAKIFAQCFSTAERMGPIPIPGPCQQYPESQELSHRSRPGSQDAERDASINEAGILLEKPSIPAAAQQEERPLLSPASPPPLNPRTPALSIDDQVSKPALTAALSVHDVQRLTNRRPNNHILLVDDNKINLQLLVMFMKKSSFSYAEAENGQEAVTCFDEASAGLAPAGRPFDYILMDISMPVMNGLEATKRIRETERERNLRPTTVIALTGLASAEARRDAISAGVDIFLPKPVRFAELQKLLTVKEAPIGEH